MSAVIQPQRLPGIRAAIIDLDGTMLDTAPDFQIAVNNVRAELGLAALDIETIKNFVGKGTENLIRRVLAVDYDAAAVEQHFAGALASYHRHYLAINGDHSTLYPQVREGLDALRANGIRLACVTNKPIAFAVPLLQKKDLHDYFEVIYGGDSLPKKKPDPYPLLKVCEDFALAPHQVVAIGDSSNDALAARAAGCRVLTVPYGYNHGRPIQEIDSDGIVATLLDAASFISASFSA
jgi:phosphoglycolate phosphatase